MGLLVLLLTAGAFLAVGLLAMLVYRLIFPPRCGLGWVLAKGLPLDPGMLGAAFAERHFSLPGGGCTAGWAITGGRPDGPVVVASHGWGENRHVTLARAASLLPHVAALVCYDLRGHGESSRARCDWSVAESADLIGIIDQLHESASPQALPRPVVLLGYSMGAATSLLAAVRDDGTRVAAVIGEGVGGNRIEPIAAVMRERRLPAALLLPAARLLLQTARVWPRQLDMVPHLHAVKCPVLLLHARGDPVCSLATAQRVAAAMPDVTLSVFDTDEHLDLARTDPQRYLAETGAFLDRTTAVHPPAAPPEPSLDV